MLYIVHGVKKSQRWLSDWTPTILKKKMELKDFILLYHSHTRTLLSIYYEDILFNIYLISI